MANRVVSSADENLLRNSPWWATPVGLTAAYAAAQQFASTAPVTAFVIGMLGLFVIASLIAILLFVFRR